MSAVPLAQLSSPFSLFFSPLLWAPLCFLPTRLLIPHFPLSIRSLCLSLSPPPAAPLPPYHLFRSLRHRGTNYGGYMSAEGDILFVRAHARTHAHAEMDIVVVVVVDGVRTGIDIRAMLFIRATKRTEPYFTVRVSQRRKPVFLPSLISSLLFFFCFLLFFFSLSPKETSSSR